MRRLREASEALVADWGQKLAEMSVHLIEEPEFRLAGAEEAIRQVVASDRADFAAPRAAGPRPGARRRPRPTAGCRPSSRPSPPAGGSRCRPATCVELLRAYPKWRFQSLVLQQASSAFLSLRGHLSDELREINFCRVRLAELQRLLEAPPDTSLSEPRAGRLVLPAGCKDLGEAVDGFLAGVGPEALLELDGRVQAVIRSQFTALVHICLASGNLLKNVEAAMLETAREFAGEVVGETNAAELFLEQHPDEGEAEGEASAFFAEAQPELVAGAVGAGVARSACWRRRRGGRRPLPRTGRAAPCRTWRCCPRSARTTSCSTARSPTCRWRSWSSSARPARDAYRQMSAAEDFTPHTRIDVDFGAAAAR